MIEEKFPPGTPVCVRQSIDHRTDPVEIEVMGTVESWADRPTGAWHAHGKNKKLWLKRLMLRKPDGELVSLVIDRGTAIAKLEARSS